jgi:hypothetical protein
MISISRKMVFAAFAGSISFGVLILLGEIGVRLFVKNGEITPEILRNRSLQYEPVIFVRHAFKQEARLVNNPFGKKEKLIWQMNEKGYRGYNFHVPKPEGVTHAIVFGGSSVFDRSNT